jgi:hypothetical protein
VNKAKSIRGRPSSRSIYVVGSPEREGKGKGVQTIFEEMKGEIFPNMMKGTNITTQEVP